MLVVGFVDVLSLALLEKYFCTLLYLLLIMVLKSIALIALLSHYVAALDPRQTGNARGSDFLRFACSQLVVERTDPLVSPGIIPSPHMHQIVGGSSFNATVRIFPLLYTKQIANRNILDGPKEFEPPFRIQMYIMQNVRRFQQLCKDILLSFFFLR